MVPKVCTPHDGSNEPSWFKHSVSVVASAEVITAPYHITPALAGPCCPENAPCPPFPSLLPAVNSYLSCKSPLGRYLLQDAFPTLQTGFAVHVCAPALLSPSQGPGRLRHGCLFPHQTLPEGVGWALTASVSARTQGPAPPRGDEMHREVPEQPGLDPASNIISTRVCAGPRATCPDSNENKGEWPENTCLSRVRRPGDSEWVRNWGDGW